MGGEIKISPEGFDLRFPKLDMDFYVPELLAVQLGSKVWMATRMRREGGKAHTPAKQAGWRAVGQLKFEARKS